MNESNEEPRFSPGGVDPELPPGERLRGLANYAADPENDVAFVAYFAEENSDIDELYWVSKAGDISTDNGLNKSLHSDIIEDVLGSVDEDVVEAVLFKKVMEIAKDVAAEVTRDFTRKPEE